MSNTLLCAACGTRITPSRRAFQGPQWLHVGLWTCALLPGMLYTLWRLLTTPRACETCGAARLVSLNTQEGQAIAAAMPENGPALIQDLKQSSRLITLAMTLGALVTLLLLYFIAQFHAQPAHNSPVLIDSVVIRCAKATSPCSK